ncbi:hypothetical protein V6N13_095172 [Hibiscus sabdariffa]|uniref:Uncharacterized protein n=1 Tax=Hibiscus sabdariffa TaxID=183260 RepID=A0ABR2PSF5_9ROSI
MTSSNCYSSLYPFPFDLNEDDQHQQQHHLFALKSHPSCRIQDQAGRYVPQDGQLESGGDSGVLKLSMWEKEEKIERDDHQQEDISYKWMPSKMRILRKMMSSEPSDLSKSSTVPATKFEDMKVQINQPSSSPDNSSNSSYNNNNNNNSPIRSLCNACGIRQRKARRAMAAAAAASNGAIVEAETTTSTKSTKVQNKAKRSSNGCVAKLKNSNKKCKLSSQPQGRTRKKLCFEDLRVKLSKNSAFHRVFPQDEKEAAILLMALSYGLVHG